MVTDLIGTKKPLSLYISLLQIILTEDQFALPSVSIDFFLV